MSSQDSVTQTDKPASASALRRGQRRRGEVVVRSAAVRLFSAVSPEGALTEPALAQRVGWLLDITTAISAAQSAAHWSAGDVAALAASRKSYAFKAWADAFGWPHPAGYVPSRIVWAALESCGRSLRSSAHRRTVVDALLAGGKPPEDADEVSVRNITRRIVRFTRDHGRAPASFWELEPAAPRTPRIAILSATDDQALVMGESSMTLLLPVRPDPQTRRDWAQHEIPVKRPAHIAAGAVMGRPTLRLKGSRVIADMPFTLPGVPRPTVVERILGVDWGVNTPLAASVVERLSDGTLATDGRPVFFKAGGLIAKINRLHEKIGDLSRKIGHQGRILRVTPDDRGPDTGPLSRRRHLLWDERLLASARLNALTQELAHLTSRWMIEQALALGCDAIAVERLADLEPRGHGKVQNARHARMPRGQIMAFAEYESKDAGLGFRKVYARGTSSKCPRCGKASRHVIAPDDRRSGYRWLACACGASLDRDHAGSERIGARGLGPGTPIVRVVRTEPREPRHAGTAPARGQRARARRSLDAMRCAGSSAVPPRAHCAPGHRAAGAGPEAACAVQVREAAIRRPARRLDGMRSAYRGGGIAASPVRQRVLSAYRQE